MHQDYESTKKEGIFVEHFLCASLCVYAGNTTFSKIHVSCSCGTFLDRGNQEGKMEVRWALKGQVEKGGKNIPEEGRDRSKAAGRVWEVLS